MSRRSALQDAHVRVRRARDGLLRELHRHRQDGQVKVPKLLDAYYELEAAERELNFAVGQSAFLD